MSGDGSILGIDDDNHILSARVQHAAPLLDRVGSTADAAPAAGVAAPAVEGADVAALGVDGHEVDGLAEPVGTDAGRVVEPAAGDAAAVEPPAVAHQELAHSIIYLTTSDLISTNTK